MPALGLGLGLPFGRSRSGIAPPPFYMGPLDDFEAGLLAAWSVARRLLTSHTGAIVRVRRSTDDTELDIGTLEDGSLDVVAMLAFCGAANGFLSQIYDQTGAGQDFSPAASQQTAIVMAGVLHANSAGYAETILTGAVVRATFATPLPRPITVYSNASPVVDSNYRVVVGLQASNHFLGITNSNSYYVPSVGGSIVATGDVDVVANRFDSTVGQDQLVVNGVADGNGGLGATTDSAEVQWGNVYGGGAAWGGGGSELVIYGAGHNLATMQAISGGLALL